MPTAVASIPNTEIIQAIYAAFGRGDVAAILTMVADDVSWDNTRVASKECPWNGNFSGKANLPGFFEAVAGELNITVFNPHTFVASGNSVAVQLSFASTLAKNGKVFANESIHMWTLNEQGLVTSYRHFNDTAMELAAWRA